MTPAHRRHTTLALAFVAALALALPARAEAENGMTRGSVALKSIGALAFGPGNVLFLADSEGAAVWAVDVGEAKATEWGREGVQDLDEKIAALLGTSPRDVFVMDMAVHAGSGRAFISVMRGRDDAAVPALVSVGGDGKVAVVPLDDVPHGKLDIANAPAEDAKLYSWDSRTFTVTDLEFIDGELYVTGLSNEEFASTLRRVPFPFGKQPSVTSLEIYHGAHGAFETFAPIFSFIPYAIAGRQHLLAGYLCTPLVTFPLEEVKQQKKLRGKTIAELGWGNIPTDIVAYENDGESYVLISNNRRGTMRIKGSDIVAANARDGITTEAGPRTGLDYETVPLGHVAQLATLDAGRILVLNRAMENGALSLAARPTSRL